VKYEAIDLNWGKWRASCTGMASCTYTRRIGALEEKLHEMYGRAA